MKQPRPESVLFLPPDLEALKRYIVPLNTEFTSLPVPGDGGWKIIRKDYRPAQRELRRLVQAWFDSGPNVKRLFDSEPTLTEAARHFQASIVATDGPTARLIYLTVPESTPIGPRSIALGLFLDFLLSPFNTRLGGPCAHCNQYFIKKNRRQKVYCSQRCGLRHTALTVNRNRRAKEHREMLEKAQESIARWAKSRVRADWKNSVSKDTMISKNWLTRRVKDGELVEPVR